MAPWILTACSVTHDHDSSDRLSNLPCDIIYHIFSFLGNNDMARIMLLSKGFYHLGISSPYLFFMADFDRVPRRSFYDRVRIFQSSHNYGIVPACSQKCKNFGNFLLKLMSKRGNAQLRALRLHWFCGNPYCTDDIVHRLIKHHASQGDLHEVDINLEENLILKKMINELKEDCPLKRNLKSLEAKVISSGEYESLSKELKDLIDYHCREVNPNEEFRGFRSLIDCRSLRVLKLNCISIYDNSFLSSLISDHAQSLVRLTLYSLHTDLHGNNLDIKSSSLQVLELFDVLSDHNVNIICPYLMDLIMRECQVTGTSSITVRAQCLLRLVYSNCREHCAKEAFILDAPNLQDVNITYSQREQGSYQLSSLRYAIPIRKFTAFLKQIIQLHGDNAVKCLLMHTPSLKNLSVNNEEWRCNISDAGLFELLRSSPSLADDEEQFVCLLEEKLNKGIEIFESNIPK